MDHATGITVFTGTILADQPARRRCGHRRPRRPQHADGRQKAPDGPVAGRADRHGTDGIKGPWRRQDIDQMSLLTSVVKVVGGRLTCQGPRSALEEAFRRREPAPGPKSSSRDAGRSALRRRPWCARCKRPPEKSMHRKAVAGICGGMWTDCLQVPTCAAPGRPHPVAPQVPDPVKIAKAGKAAAPGSSVR